MTATSKKIAYISLSIVFFVVCSWITVPFTIPFTMQTFALVLILNLLGGKYSLIVCAVYILLGAIGLPIFSGFGSGFGVLLGATGGYIWGFLLSSLLFVFIRPPKKYFFAALLSLASIIVCYLFGTAWYAYIYTGTQTTFASAFAVCVLPFVLPDLAKCLLAVWVAQKVRPFLFTNNQF